MLTPSIKLALQSRWQEPDHLLVKLGTSMLNWKAVTTTPLHALWFLLLRPSHSCGTRPALADSLCAPEQHESTSKKNMGRNPTILGKTQTRGREEYLREFTPPSLETGVSTEVAAWPALSVEGDFPSRNVHTDRILKYMYEYKRVGQRAPK